MSEQRQAAQHHFQSVVFRRIVRTGHSNAGAAAEMVRSEIEHRRGLHADVLDVDARRHDTLHESCRQGRSGKATVAAHAHGLDALASGPGAEHFADAAHNVFGQRFSNDAADVVGLEDRTIKLHRNSLYVDVTAHSPVRSSLHCRQFCLWMGANLFLGVALCARLLPFVVHIRQQRQAQGRAKKA